MFNDLFQYSDRTISINNLLKELINLQNDKLPWADKAIYFLFNPE